MNILNVPFRTDGTGTVQSHEGAIIAVAIAPTSGVGACLVGDQLVAAGGVVPVPPMAVHTIKAIHPHNRSTEAKLQSVDLIVWTADERPPSEVALRAPTIVKPATRTLTAGAPTAEEIARIPYTHRTRAQLWLTPLSGTPTITLTVYGLRFSDVGLATQDVHMKQLGSAVAVASSAAPSAGLGAFARDGDAISRLGHSLALGGTDHAESWDVLAIFAATSATVDVHVEAEADGDAGVTA